MGGKEWRECGGEDGVMRRRRGCGEEVREGGKEGVESLWESKGCEGLR